MEQLAGGVGPLLRDRGGRQKLTFEGGFQAPILPDRLSGAHPHPSGPCGIGPPDFQAIPRSEGHGVGITYLKISRSAGIDELPW